MCCVHCICMCYNITVVMVVTTASCNSTYNDRNLYYNTHNSNKRNITASTIIITIYNPAHNFIIYLSSQLSYFIISSLTCMDTTHCVENMIMVMRDR